VQVKPAKQTPVSASLQTILMIIPKVTSDGAVTFLSWSFKDAVTIEMVKEYATIGGARVGRENRRARRKPAQVPLSPPQIPHNQGRRSKIPATIRSSYVRHGCADVYKSLNLYRTEN
jgi:hypothetical protein